MLERLVEFLTRGRQPHDIPPSDAAMKADGALAEYGQLKPELDRMRRLYAERMAGQKKRPTR